MDKAVGIDFGTTNSVIAVLEGGEPVIIPNSRGERLTPSIVSVTRDGEVLIGSAAKNQSIINHERTVISVKRMMGTDFTIEIDGQRFTAAQIASFIIHQLKKDAEEFLGEPITSAIITVPAYFNDLQRKSVKAAGEMAGLNVLRLINEPTAASLAYGLPREREGMILIFDLGGGTFDVSILDVSGTVYEVTATRGNNRLGGDDFDAALVQHICSGFLESNGIDLREDRMALQKVREAAEQVKKELSSANTASLNVPFISADPDGPKHLDMEITREKFEELIAGFLKEIDGVVDLCLEDAAMEADEIDAVVLVGGSTRIPCVHRLLEQRFGPEKIMKTVSPDESVAAGAAIQAGIMTGNVTGLVLVDVTPLTLGIETENDVFVPIIERNSCIPTSKGRVFTTVADNQTQVEVHVLQGERPQASKNFSLGRFQLTGIKPGPKGAPRIEVTFDIDANGIVHVSARDNESGRMEEVAINASVKALSEDEVETFLKDASLHNEEDELFIQRNELLKQAQALQMRLRARVAFGSGSDPAPELMELVAYIDEALRGRDIEQIKNAIESTNAYLSEPHPAPDMEKE